MSKLPKTTAILPAGIYFIGDPCYLFKNDSGGPGDQAWDDICRQIDENPSYVGKLISFADKLAFIGGTAYGDGTYNDYEGHKYGVDAGLIGCSPIEWNMESYDDLNELGHVHTFDNDVECVWTADGTFVFNNVVIHTGDEGDGEQDDDHYGDHWDEEEDEEE